jgi:uncharacterized protein (TIGR02300 family)
VTNPALGTKRSCPQCNANFYDLNKSPAVCPKCKHSFDPALQVKAKKKAARKSGKDEEAIAAKLDLAAKKAEAQKKKKSRDDSDEAAHDIEEMDELDDIDGLSELEGADGEKLNEDDADDETIIEDMADDGGTLVDNIEEEEAQALVDEIEDEQVEVKKTSKKKPTK